MKEVKVRFVSQGFSGRIMIEIGTGSELYTLSIEVATLLEVINSNKECAKKIVKEIIETQSKTHKKILDLLRG